MTIKIAEDSEVEDEDEFDDDLFSEDEDEEEEVSEIARCPWKILIVDDEKDVHTTTKIALRNVEFEQRPLEFISAFSGEEAVIKLDENPDTALILLDVVMEKDDAGLCFAQRVRDEMSNLLVRIILRTGQPGQAPEKRVIIDYDINDYKAKTELTTTRLFTAVVSALRSYRDLHRIETNKLALMKIVDASASIFNMQSLNSFVTAILSQMTSILPLSDQTMVLRPSSLATNVNNGEYTILGGTGSYSTTVSAAKMRESVPKHALRLIEIAFREKCNVFENNNCALYIQGMRQENRFVTYLEGYGRVDDWERQMIDIFCRNLSIAYDNVRLVGQLESSNHSLQEKVHQQRQALETLQARVAELEGS